MPQLVLTLNDQGEMQVSGPIRNKVLAFGMLELAKESIIKYHDEQAKARVQLASPDDLPADKG